MGKFLARLNNLYTHDEGCRFSLTRTPFTLRCLFITATSLSPHRPRRPHALTLTQVVDAHELLLAELQTELKFTHALIDALRPPSTALSAGFVGRNSFLSVCVCGVVCVFVRGNLIIFASLLPSGLAHARARLPVSQCIPLLIMLLLLIQNEHKLLQPVSQSC
jgi:hypothetical protein